jgi:hypothetical protein
MPLPSDKVTEIKQGLKDAEAALKDADSEIAKARLAGLDVTEQQKEAEELRKRVKQIKAVYGK